MTKQNDLNLVIVLQVLNKWKKIMALIVIASVAISVIICLFLPKYYKSEAVIMPVGGKASGGGLASIASQLGGLSSFSGLGADIGQTPSQQFLALLKTRSLAERVINQLNLLNVFFKDGIPKNNFSSDDPKAYAMEMGSNMLVNSYMKFDEDKMNGTLKISAEFEDPVLSKAVVMAYVEGLQDFLNENALTVAKRNRLFIETRLARNKEDLLEAGKMLNEFYKGDKISNIDSTIDVPVEKNIDTNDALQKEVQNLEARTTEIEKELVKDIPQQVYLQYLNLRRSLLIQTNSLLTQQYEMAKIQESKDELSFQLIDPPDVPQVRSKPKRKEIVIMTFFAALISSGILAFLGEYLRKLNEELSKQKNI